MAAGIVVRDEGRGTKDEGRRTKDEDVGPSLARASLFRSKRRQQILPLALRTIVREVDDAITAPEVMLKDRARLR